MKEGRNPITMILLGVGFVLLSVGGLLATLVGSLIASGPLGWIASGAGIVIGGTASWLFIGQIGATIIGFAGYVLQFASVIFEILLSYTVIGFGATLSEYGILGGIKTVWTAFRDIANIIIVGMFVFVAIATILNNTNYGVKKFLVRILIVAVMINFSLLLTQIVIDLSHIAANQFYIGIRASVVNGPANIQQQSDNRSLSDLWGAQGGVAGVFQKRMGISSSEDNAKLINDMSKKSFIAALLYILVTPILLFATAGVFLYGGYLLLARALVIIVLLVTSALAFATWLIPKYGEGRYGWSGWVEALIQSAVFAPLLMMFLWATLKILENATPGSLGAVLTDARSAWDGSRTIIIYLFTIGMLYLSINIANSFSQKITGFALAQKGLGSVGRAAGSLLGAVGVQTSRLAQRAQKTSFGGWMRDGATTEFGYKLGWRAAAQRGAGRLGTQLLNTLSNASYNPARMAQALKERQGRFAKDYGLKEQGKGGIEAFKKRASSREEDFQKKVRGTEEGAFESGSKMSGSERKDVFDRAFKEAQAANSTALAGHEQTLSDNQNYLSDVQTSIKKLTQAIESEAPGSAKFNQLHADRRSMQENLNATQSRIQKAQSGIEALRDPNLYRKAGLDALAKEKSRREEAWLDRRFGEKTLGRAEFKKWVSDNRSQKQRIREYGEAFKASGVGKRDDGGGTPTPAPAAPPKGTH